MNCHQHNDMVKKEKHIVITVKDIVKKLLNVGFVHLKNSVGHLRSTTVLHHNAILSHILPLSKKCTFCDLNNQFLIIILINCEAHFTAEVDRLADIISQYRPIAEILILCIGHIMLSDMH